MIGMVPMPPLSDSHIRELAASNRGRPPTQCPTRTQGGAAVDALETTLGGVLLVVAGLAVVLLAVILVLAEVDLIVRLVRRLAGRRRLDPSGLARDRRSSDDRVAERVPGEQGGR
jgi:Na+-transporting methylmalonyl-CoA/oxaloacetate decarboxylase gamma subunit